MNIVNGGYKVFTQFSVVLSFSQCLCVQWRDVIVAMLAVIIALGY